MYYRLKSPALTVIALLVVVLALAHSPQPAQAVDNATALIDAITAANATGDVINLSGNITLSAVHNTDQGNSGLPTITGNVAINGNGYSISRDAGAANFRIVFISDSGTLTLNNVTLANGRLGAGGAIRNHGTLIVNNSTFSNNTSTGGNGGSIFNDGHLTVSGSTFTGNGAGNGGGAISNADDSTLIVSGSTFTGNHATNNGGAIVNRGHLTVSGSSFANNHAVNTGGAIRNWGNSSTANISASVFDGNTSDTDGGAIRTETAMHLTNSTIANNQAVQDGGGISNAGTLTVINITIAFNLAGSDGNNVQGGGDYHNTVIAGSLPGNCAPSSFGASVLSTDDTCSGATEASLAELALDTFTGQVFPLNVDSVAVGAGDPGFCPSEDQLGQTRKNPCDAGAYEIVFAVGDDGQIIVKDPPGPPAPPMCNAVNENGVNAYDLPDGFYCRVLMQNGAWRTNHGTVPAELIENGVILAVDVFQLSGRQPQNDFGGHVPVCLQGSGRLIFLDATTSPRAMIELETFNEGGSTCGWVPNAGTLVLIEGN